MFHFNRDFDKTDLMPGRILHYRKIVGSRKLNKEEETHDPREKEKVKKVTCCNKRTKVRMI